mmetsp:Transcript_51464/g.161758  ORF Transcript_51464/g.161758 Transcript_51464/m.161758 type:complete len:268 (-) Transcript_51464:36-839(-)
MVLTAQRADVGTKQPLGDAILVEDVPAEQGNHGVAVFEGLDAYGTALVQRAGRPGHLHECVGPEDGAGQPAVRGAKREQQRQVHQPHRVSHVVREEAKHDPAAAVRDPPRDHGGGPEHWQQGRARQTDRQDARLAVVRDFQEPHPPARVRPPDFPEHDPGGGALREQRGREHHGRKLLGDHLRREAQDARRAGLSDGQEEEQPRLPDDRPPKPPAAGFAHQPAPVGHLLDIALRRETAYDLRRRPEPAHPAAAPETFATARAAQTRL